MKPGVFLGLNLRSLGALFGAAFIITFLYSKTRAINIKQHLSFVQGIQKLKELNAVMNQNILKSRFGLLAYYDPLVGGVKELRKTEGQLNTVPDFVSRAERKNMDRILKEIRNALDRQEKLIEHYKSNHAILKNSLQYFTVVAVELMEDPRIRKNRRLLDQLSLLLTNILVFNLTNDNGLEGAIAAEIRAISKTETGISNFAQALSHAQSILRYKPQVYAITQEVTGLPIEPLLNELDAVYLSAYEDIHGAVMIYEFALYVFCVGLLALIVRGVLRLQKYSSALEDAKRNLENKVEERTKALLQSEKMGAVGQLAAGIAHEINNPLGVIMGFAQSLAKRLKPGDLMDIPIKSIERESIRCKSLVQDLLTFSRSSVGDVEVLDLNAVIKETIVLIETRSKMVGVEIKRNLAEGLPQTLGNKVHIQQIIVNLANNAFDAMSQGGTLTLSTELLEEGGLSWILIKITDTGEGIPSAIIGKIFNPFFTTKAAGKGTGLGLSLVYEMVQRNSGTIEVKSRPGCTEFMIKFSFKTGKEFEMHLKKTRAEMSQEIKRHYNDMTRYGKGGQ